MAANDRILLDGILDERVAHGLPSAKRDEVFEYFVFEQLLKFADLSSDEIESGWVDGDDDGGIDGFYVFVNGHLVTDPEVLRGVRRADLQVWVISSKHHDTFRQATVDKLVATIAEFFDFRKPTGAIQERYSSDLLAARDRLIAAYRILSTKIDTFRVNVAYASRGDASTVGEEVAARGKQVESALRELFGHCKATFSFIGSSELITLTRQARKYSLELPFLEYFGRGERYVLLTSLTEYAAFVTDEKGELRRYLFDSNVRDFVGLNRVNEDIAESLEVGGGPDFWWLNNGITILVTKAMITGDAIMMDDVQIVNGLQTTESIARFFAQGGKDDARSVLVKVIKTEDPAVRDAIIKATNNQTTVEQQSLHATDKIQRDIEEILLRSGWYYDRRQNFYANKGVPLERIISPLYLAGGCAGVLMRSPSGAATLKQKFMRNEHSYRSVFSERVPLDAWPKLAAILKLVDAELNELRSAEKPHLRQKFLKAWRHLVALIVVARTLGKFTFRPEEFAKIDIAQVTPEKIREVWADVTNLPGYGDVATRRKMKRKFVLDVCIHVADKCQATGGIDPLTPLKLTPSSSLVFVL
jgi:hypothetical protein